MPRAIIKEQIVKKLPDPDIPVEEINVTEAWLRLIRLCQAELPYGWIKVQLANGEPKQMLDHEKEIRFDKEDRSYGVKMHVKGKEE